MQFNRDSNSYILIFVAIMVGVVAVSLAFVNTALTPTIKGNEVLSKKIQILSSVVSGVEFTPEFVTNEYNTKVEEFFVDSLGDIVTDAAGKPFDLDFKKELRKPAGERNYPVFKYKGDKETYYVIPLEGSGLWDRIWGYLAVKEDFVTIHGSSFGHKGETPGLGALITEDWFTSQFSNKRLFSPEGKYELDIMKGRGNAQVKTDVYKVDGLSGATITAQGVEDMLYKVVGFYRPFFEKQKVN